MKKYFNIGQFVWVVIMLLLLMIPCIYNAFPLITSDSGTYIASGLQPFVPIDRPIFYGLFVGYLSLKSNLFLPIIAQSLILAILLLKIYKHFLVNSNKGLSYFFITFIICTVTGIAWYSGQLMPDIFVGIGFLSFILLISKQTSKYEKYLLSIFYLIALITHNSHMLIFLILSILTLIIVGLNSYGIKKYVPLKRIQFVLILSLASWLINPTINFAIERKFKHSGSPYAFLAAKYAENGLLTEYLKEKCVTQINNNNQVDQGTYFIKNIHSNLFLDVEGYSMDAGAKIHQWEYTGVDNQKFKIEKAQNQQVKIVSVKSGKYVTVYTNNEGKLALKQENDLNNNSQLFQLKYYSLPNIVAIKLFNQNAYLGSDTLNKLLGIQFIAGNQANANFCKYELISGANCFCYFKDSIPNSAVAFLWNNRSILSRTGNWANHEKEYKFVMNDILFSTDYFGKNVGAAFHATITQLTKNNIGDGIFKYDTTSSPYFAIKTFFPSSKQLFFESRENVGLLDFIFLNYINQKTMMISLVITLLFIAIPFFRNKINPLLIVLTVLTYLMLIINAFVTGAMANVLDRLQSRVSWVLPLVAIIMVLNLIEELWRANHDEDKKIANTH